MTLMNFVREAMESLKAATKQIAKKV